jgi:2-iminobutanoate/2-iminopropanoate deaminase
MPKQVPGLANAPQPLAPYSVATESCGLVFIAGQVAIPAGGGPIPADTADQARVILDNLGVILGDLGLEYSDVVKTTIFLTDMGDFAAVNDVYGSYFREAPPARSTVQVAALPRPEFTIEIEAIAAR